MSRDLPPLFPQVRGLLSELAERDQPGIEIPLGATIVGNGRDVETCLRTTFQKIVKQAGLSPIPKAFLNARSTRATELAETFPGRVAAAGSDTVSRLPIATIDRSPTSISNRRGNLIRSRR